MTPTNRSGTLNNATPAAGAGRGLMGTGSGVGLAGRGEGDVSGSADGGGATGARLISAAASTNGAKPMANGACAAGFEGPSRGVGLSASGKFGKPVCFPD